MKARLAGLLLAVILCSATAQAAPILTMTVLDNDQVVGPTDAVLLSLRISNVGDEIFRWTISAGGWVPSGHTPQYLGTAVYPWVPYDDLPAGSWIDVPWLMFNPRAGGAEPGAYFAEFSASLGQYDGPSGTAIIVGTFGDTFRWTVANAVFEPGTLALLIAGVVGITAARRRTS